MEFGFNSFYAYTIRYTRPIFTCAKKLTNSHLNKPHGAKKSNKETKNKKQEKKRSRHKVRGVSPEAGKESMVGKIKVGFEAGVKETGSYISDLKLELKYSWTIER